jgi:hypothetical protein
MHILKFKFTTPFLLACFAIVGCADKPTYVDQHFGEAVNAAKAQQVINPDAPLALYPVGGVDGQAANAAIDRYHRSFTQPPASGNVFTIGVGSGGGSGGSSSGGASK